MKSFFEIMNERYKKDKELCLSQDLGIVLSFPCLIAERIDNALEIDELIEKRILMHEILFKNGLKYEKN